jgi:hypothetical protein
MVMLSPFTGDALDPPLWKIPYTACLGVSLYIQYTATTGWIVNRLLWDPGPVEKEDAKTCRACAWRCANNGWEKRNFVIGSALLPIALDLALRSNKQRQVDVLRMREQPVLMMVMSFICSCRNKNQPNATLVYDCRAKSKDVRVGGGG